MRSQDLQSNLVRYSVIHSGHQEYSNCIDLAGIGDCEKLIYDRYVSGHRMSVSEKLRTRLSSELKADVICRLKQLEYYSPGEEISLEGGLVLGHTDGFVGADLLEVKILEQEAWIPEPHHLPNRTFVELQSYMHYIGLSYAQVVYLARDTGAIKAVGVGYNLSAGDRVASKVQRLAAAARNYQRPDCSCGRCG